MSAGNTYMKLTAKAAAGDREAARQLVLGGWWPASWDPDSEVVQDRVIEGSRRAVMVAVRD